MCVHASVRCACTHATATYTCKGLSLTRGERRKGEKDCTSEEEKGLMCATLFPCYQINDDHALAQMRLRLRLAIIFVIDSSAGYFYD